MVARNCQSTLIHRHNILVEIEQRCFKHRLSRHLLVDTAQPPCDRSSQHELFTIREFWIATKDDISPALQLTLELACCVYASPRGRPRNEWVLLSPQHRLSLFVKLSINTRPWQRCMLLPPYQQGCITRNNRPVEPGALIYPQRIVRSLQENVRPAVVPADAKYSQYSRWLTF
ncbi:hypothetical protein BDW22DRAFT_726829 [Trametopsis cervina]|nr:hypothetical protein BDW22DRAFT_726829 [Trametopsis cervina]